MNSIIRFNANQNAVAPSAVVSGTFEALTKGHPIRGALRDLFLAFPSSMGLPAEDKQRKAEIFMLALQDYPVLIAVAALESLLLDNPQDPFLPTPPEVLKRCKRFDYDWWKPTLNT